MSTNGPPSHDARHGQHDPQENVQVGILCTNSGLKSASLVCMRRVPRTHTLIEVCPDNLDAMENEIALLLMLLQPKGPNSSFKWRHLALVVFVGFLSACQPP
jgi:hypothetical protein